MRIGQIGRFQLDFGDESQLNGFNYLKTLAGKTQHSSKLFEHDGVG
jgi:hypothetical protein